MSGPKHRWKLVVTRPPFGATGHHGQRAEDHRCGGLWDRGHCNALHDGVAFPTEQDAAHGAFCPPKCWIMLDP